jgi:hypothetical protein
VNTAKSDSRLPEDVLVIHYADLSPDPLTRLQTARAIGKLLDAADEPQQLSDLSHSSISRQVLKAWLNQEPASRFWKTEGDTVEVTTPRETYILVGTNLLLQDLNTVTHIPRLPRLEEIDVVWQAAHRLVEQVVQSEQEEVITYARWR